MNALLLQPHLGMIQSNNSIKSTKKINDLMKSVKKMHLKVDTLLEMIFEDQSSKQVVNGIKSILNKHQEDLIRMRVTEVSVKHEDLTLTSISPRLLFESIAHESPIKVEVVGDLRSKFKGDFEVLSYMMLQILNEIGRCKPDAQLIIDAYRSHGYVKLDMQSSLVNLIGDDAVEVIGKVLGVHYGKLERTENRLVIMLPTLNT